MVDQDMLEPFNMNVVSVQTPGMLTLSTDSGGCSPCICFAPTGSSALAWTVSAVSVTCDGDAAAGWGHIGLPS